MTEVSWWQKSRIAWDKRERALQYISRGDTESEIERLLYEDGLPLSRNSIRNLKKALPDLKYDQIIRLPSEVQSYWRALNDSQGATTMAPTNVVREELWRIARIGKHQSGLQGVLQSIVQLKPFPMSGHEIVSWQLHGLRYTRPIDQGTVVQKRNGSFSIELDFEQEVAFAELKRHVPSCELGKLLDEYKLANIKDVQARLSFADNIRLDAQEYIGLPIIGNVQTSMENCVDSYYWSQLYDQNFARLIGIPRSSRVARDFSWVDIHKEGDQGGLSFVGGGIVVLGDEGEKKRAQKFFLNHQDTFCDSLLAATAKTAYFEAESATNALVKMAGELLNSSDIPGKCETCNEIEQLHFGQE